MEILLTDLLAWQLSPSGVTLAFLVSITLYVFIEFLLNYLHDQHIQTHRHEVPSAFREQIRLEEHQKAADYAHAKLSLSRWVLVVDSLILVAFTLGGGFQALYDWTVDYSGLSGIWQEIDFLLLVMLVMGVIGLPLSLYSTFGIETRFGFNKTTPAKFLSDLLKTLLLTLAIGIPLLWAMLSIMTEFMDGLWWLYAWAVWMGFNLLLLWAYPSWIAPLFNQFTPLETGKMKTRIEALLQKTGFDSKGIFVMDGSSRSGHGNAYFTGFGKNKRIVFFDTLLEKLSVDEVEAVLAHELGHFKHGHIKKRLISGAFMTLLGFALLAWLMNQPAFYEGLGFTSQTPAIALLLFMVVLPSFFFWLSPLSAYRSRQDEFEADAFAVTHTSADALTTALVGLYRDNAATLTPHPWHSAYHDSHPPASIRIAQLHSTSASRGKNI
jgi:STE24 endopeptidase